jgi:DNA-binding NarL/FixJ family response regulator
MKNPPRRALLALRHHLRGPVEVALAASGWHGEWVGGAAEALGRLKARSFDAVVAQSDLPDCSGRELLQQVLGLGKDLPVVFLALPGAEREIAEALGYGAAGYVLVTPDLPELLCAVLDHCALVSRSRALERRGLDEQHRAEIAALCRNIRHELNNPLTGILGHAEMGLADPSVTPVLDRRLRAIVEQAEKVRDFLRLLEHSPEQMGLLQEVE